MKVIIGNKYKFITNYSSIIVKVLSVKDEYKSHYNCLIIESTADYYEINEIHSFRIDDRWISLNKQILTEEQIQELLLKASRLSDIIKKSNQYGVDSLTEEESKEADDICEYINELNGM